jgi:hypothetical protein
MRGHQILKDKVSIAITGVFLISTIIIIVFQIILLIN